MSTATPKRVWLTWYGEKDGVTTMKGRATSFDDVSEFMRALNNIVQCPRGLARVVGRERNGTVRVELIGARPPAVIAYPAGDVHFFFSGFELKSASSQGDLIEFELTSSAMP